MINILIGIAGLGIVVFIHELGHFIAARLSGIRVLAFSVGWGKPILHKTIGGVDYRIGMFPVGGYCQMDGEEEYKEALVNGNSEIRRTPGTFWGAHPIKRIIVSFMGPFFNWLFAVVVLAIVSLVGYSIYTSPNRIVMASDVDSTFSGPANIAGLETGDIILSINGRETKTSQDISRIIAENPDKDLQMQILRDKTRVDLTVKPSLDKDSGAGKIGVYFWIDPLVEQVSAASPAAIAGIKKGDYILSVNGIPVSQQMDFFKALDSKPGTLQLRYARGELIEETELVISWNDNEENTNVAGISFALEEQHIKESNLFTAFGSSVKEVQSTFISSFTSLGTLFRGVNLSKAVSGPLRITHMVGQTTISGFQEGAASGFISLFRFLAYISIVLSLMNLLPIPALDGGMIIVFLIELIIRRPIKTKILYRFQVVGTVIIMALLVLTFISDAFFLMG